MALQTEEISAAVLSGVRVWSLSQNFTQDHIIYGDHPTLGPVGIPLKTLLQWIGTDTVGIAATTTDPGTPTAVVKYTVKSLTADTSYPNFKDSTGAAIVVPANTSGFFQYTPGTDGAVGYWDFIETPFPSDAIRRSDIDVSGGVAGYDLLKNSGLIVNTNYAGTDFTSTSSVIYTSNTGTSTEANAVSNFSGWYNKVIQGKKGDQISFTGITDNAVDMFAIVAMTSATIAAANIIGGAKYTQANTLNIITYTLPQDCYVVLQFRYSSLTTAITISSIMASITSVAQYVKPSEIGVTVQPYSDQLIKLQNNSEGNDVLDPITLTWSSGYYNGSADNVTADTGWQHTQKIDVSGFNKINISAFTIGGSFSYVKWIKSDNTLLTGVNWGTSESGIAHDLTIPDGAKYLAFSVQSTITGIVISNYVAAEKVYVTPSDIEDYSSLQTAASKVNTNSVDNKTALDVSPQTGYFGDVNSFNITSDTNWKCAKINIGSYAGKKIIVNIPTIGGSFSYIKIMQNNGVSSSAQNNGVADSGKDITVSVLVNAQYLCLSWSATSATPTVYGVITEEVFVTPNKLSSYQSMLSYWSSKKIVWLGTSIPAQGYPQLVGNKIGASIYNEAVGSSQIRSGTSVYSTDPLTDTYLGLQDNYYDTYLYSLGTSQSEKAYVMWNWTAARRQATLIAAGYTSDQVASVKGFVDILKGSLPAGGTDPTNQTTPSSKPVDIMASQWDSFRKTCLSYCFDTATDALTDLAGAKSGTIQGKVDKYLNSNYNIDLWVFDHGHNDYKSSETAAAFATIPANTVDPNYFLGAINRVVKRILAYNPRAKFAFMGHYTDKAGAGSEPVRIKAAHLAVSAYWQAPFCDLYNRMRVGQAIVTTNGYWSSNTVWNATGFDGSNDTSTHQESSNDKTAYQLADGTWVRNLTEKQTWFFDDLHPVSDEAKDYYAECITGWINTIR